MPALPDRAVRRRGRPQRGRRRTGLDPVRRRRRLDRRRDHPRRDDARATPPWRCTRTTSAYRHLIGTRGGAAADRPPHPDRRRRARRPGVRHRRGEGDARARPERLRDRPAARPAQPDHHGRARRDHRARPVRGAGPVRGALRDRGGAARGRPDRGREAPVPALGGALPACDTTVEPRLSLQWCVRVDPLAKAAGDAVRDGRATIDPPELAPRYFHWVDDMRDWCISRQLWWGHRIPVWYWPDGEVRLRRARRGAAAGEGWTQDPDVLDTWFSSALWPFSTLGWPEDTPDLRALLPDQRARHRLRHPVLLGRADDDVRPVRDARPRPGRPCRSGRCALHGLVRDAHGKKMSKSAGNVVDPLDWIDRLRRRRTRFTLARGANPGSDMPVSEEWVAGSRNFCNKLWNATRFALLNGAHASRAAAGDDAVRAPTAWILSRLAAVTARSTRCYERFEFGQDVERSTTSRGTRSATGTWSLPRLLAGRGPAPATTRARGARRRARHGCCACCTRSMPFVTEELWTALTGGSRWWSAATWPPADAGSRRRRRRGGDRRAACAWSPRSAGSGPTRDCSPASASPARAGRYRATPLAAHEPRDPRAAAAERAGRRVHARPRRCGRGGVHGRARPVGRDRRRGRARRLEKDLAAAQKEASSTRQARQRGVHRQGPAGRGRQGARPARRRRGRHRARHRGAGGVGYAAAA